MDSARDNAEPSTSGLGIEPRLTTLSDYPIWRPEIEEYIKQLKRIVLSDAICRQRLLNCIPDAKPFRHLGTTWQILDALGRSYRRCMLHGFCPDTPNKSLRSWKVEDICEYSCCEHCKSVKASVKSLVGNRSLFNTSPVKIQIREKEDTLLLGCGKSPLLSVSITHVEKNKKADEARLRVFDMMVRNDEVWSSTDAFRSTCEERLQLAIRWFQQCTSKHTCRPSNVGFVPRRLIYVGDSDLQPHLIETVESLQEIDVKYAALSYCWGAGGGTFTTTFENIEANKQQIPLDKLPPTIQDAIYICGKLGFQYLWVDALCIIQDPGNADWLEQSGKMRLIYSNAQLTIAADESPACTAGFWHPVNTRFQKFNDCCWIRDAPARNEDVLSTRGWTLQERILSHRILHFSNTGISWECDACCRFEDGETKIDFMGLSYRAFRLLNRSTPHEHLRMSDIGYNTGDDGETNRDSVHITDFLTSGSWKSIFFAWAAIIENYSVRNLTQPNDKLSAISGLASFVLTEAGLGTESYLAGLWKEDLVEGLLWYVSGAQGSRSWTTYIAPTWSWASMAGRIKYFHDRYQFGFKPHIRINDAHCTASQSDPTGRVTAGSIHLDGLMVEGDLAAVPYCPSFIFRYKDAGGSPIRAQGHQLTFIRLHQRAGRDGNEKTRWYEVMCDEETKLTGPDLDHLYDYQGDIADNSPRDDKSGRSRYFCLSMGELVDSFTGGKQDWFLVLRKTLDDNETYQRVGIGYQQYSIRRQFSLFNTGDVYHISLI